MEGSHSTINWPCPLVPSVRRLCLPAADALFLLLVFLRSNPGFRRQSVKGSWSWLWDPQHDFTGTYSGKVFAGRQGEGRLFLSSKGLKLLLSLFEFRQVQSSRLLGSSTQIFYFTFQGPILFLSVSWLEHRSLDKNMHSISFAALLPSKFCPWPNFSSVFHIGVQGPHKCCHWDFTGASDG